MKVLLAVDGSACTKRMLAYVAAHDEWLGARHRYTVLNVVPLMPPRAAVTAARDVIQRYYHDEAERVRSCRLHEPAGPPQGRIPQCAA
ncbi:MAG: hypothetical protein Q8L95_02040 [Burkholderiales bacterium]|nr:hypothetical protein [Burkholderiales bacterium]